MSTCLRVLEAILKRLKNLSTRLVLEPLVSAQRRRDDRVKPQKAKKAECKHPAVRSFHQFYDSICLVSEDKRRNQKSQKEISQCMETTEYCASVSLEYHFNLALNTHNLRHSNSTRLCTSMRTSHCRGIRKSRKNRSGGIGYLGFEQNAPRDTSSMGQ